MSKMVSLTIEVPKAEIVMLHEVLRFSRNRHKSPERLIKATALDGAMGLATSTVDVSHWKHLWDFADKLGVARPI